MISESTIKICGHGSGTPSIKNMETYLSSRYNSYANNGKHKGVIAVKRLKALKDEDRQKFADTYKTIVGRNEYSQNLRQYVYTPYGKKYYSDCSSSICATYQKIGYSVSLLNTAGIYESNLFEDVPAIISLGHIMNPDCLKVGDCLLFVGNDPGRPLQIGHVEAVYEMPTQEQYTETPIKATLHVKANELNIRSTPSQYGEIVGSYSYNALVVASAKCGEWFKTDKGWISRKYVCGWILEDGRYWYIDNGSYPMHCAYDIDGDEFHFDKDGWMIDKNRISDIGSIIY